MVKNPLIRLWNRFFAPVIYRRFPQITGFQLLGENLPKLANLRPIVRLLKNSRVLPPKIQNIFYKQAAYNIVCRRTEVLSPSIRINSWADFLV